MKFYLYNTNKLKYKKNFKYFDICYEINFHGFDIFKRTLFGYCFCFMHKI